MGHTGPSWECHQHHQPTTLTKTNHLWSNKTSKVIHIFANFPSYEPVLLKLDFNFTKNHQKASVEISLPPPPFLGRVLFFVCRGYTSFSRLHPHRQHIFPRSVRGANRRRRPSSLTAARSRFRSSGKITPQNTLISTMEIPKFWSSRLFVKFFFKQAKENYPGFMEDFFRIFNIWSNSF